MPLLGAIVLFIQFCFAYHVLKTGRPYWWLFVIMGFPVIGCVLYYFIEVFPGTRESRSAEKAIQSISKALDPDRELRERVADLENCGSVDNRIALARQCLEHGMRAEAIKLYRSCLDGIYENDPDIRFGLAHTLELNASHADAGVIADRLMQTHPKYRPSEVRLILAKSLEGQHQLDQALAEFRVLADTYAGEEARWRYGALLKRMGKSAEAAEVFQGMLRRAERMPESYRDAQGEWLTLARDNLHA